MNSIWMNLGIEDYSFYELAKNILPKCEYEIFRISEEVVNAAILMPKRFENSQMLVPRFHYVTKNEQQDILDGKWKTDIKYELEIMPYGFYFPDCALRFLGRVIPGGFDPIIEQKIEKYYYEDGCLVINKRMLYFAVFIILHEYGHYISFKKYDGDKAAYARHIYDSKEEFRKYENILKDKTKISREENDERLLIYRNGEEEKFADNYALEHLEDAVQEAISIIKKQNSI